MTLTLEKQREQRVAIGDFVKKISVGYQAMKWFTWTAKNNSNAFSSETEIDTYDNEMKKVFPDIVAARVALAAVDVEHQGVVKGTHIQQALYFRRRPCKAYRQVQGRAGSREPIGCIEGDRRQVRPYLVRRRCVHCKHLCVRRRAGSDEAEQRAYQPSCRRRAERLIEIKSFDLARRQ